MSVNISKNALDSTIGSDITEKKGARQALTRLSSGVSLPEVQPGRTGTTQPVADSTEVSNEAVSLSIQQESRLADITSMQEQVGNLDLVQTALEDVSANLWGLEKHAAAARSEPTENRTPVPDNGNTAETLQTAEEENFARQEELQQTTSDFLAGIDHTGSELMDFLQKFRESYTLDMDISTGSLGRIDSESSLASLGKDVPLSSPKAGDIIAQAQEEVASFQVSTEMHRTNLLNDIGKELTGFTSNLADSTDTSEFSGTLQEAKDMLLQNPAALADISARINTSQAATLLLS